MALSAPTESPAVVVREIDLTGGVPNVQSTTGAIVGQFRWGPIGQRQIIANETELVATFAAPTTDNNVSFLSATQFLKYSSTLQVVRETREGVDSGDTNALAWSSGTPNALFKRQVENDEEFRNLEATLTAIVEDGYSNGGNIQFMAKYAGALGNSLQVSILPADTTDTKFDAWAYSGSFNARPGTSVFAQSKGSTGDEVHIAIIDQDGEFTGTRGTVLETFPNLSILRDAKDATGSTVYAKEVINARSEYVKLLNFPSALDSAGAGDLTSLSTSYLVDSADRAATTLSFVNGNNTATVGIGDLTRGYDLFTDKDQVEVDFIIAQSAITQSAQTTLVNHLVGIATARKDCVVVASPDRNAVLNTANDTTRVTNTLATAATFTRSSYLVVDNNFLKVYDKYSDAYAYVPASSTVAGIMAATDFNRAPWFSPAGSRRGQLLGVTALAYSPTKGQRDSLYKAGVNPIANIPGQGVLLFGDKTFLGRVSAFDRINVRRLFLVLERAIGRAAEQVLFEFNDEFTRAEFVNIVEPVLREVQGRRGITDFRVVADETNNTSAVIDRNEFIASIFIKPARSINFVTLNFVAVRTGVDFEEVVGTV
jgi:hypothetical protein